MKQQLIFALLCASAQLIVSQQECSSNSMGISLWNKDRRTVLGQMNPECSFFTWTIAAAKGGSFALILANLSLANNESLNIHIHEDSNMMYNSLSCDSRGCDVDRRIFVIQPDKRFFGQAEIKLQGNTGSDKVYFTAVAVSSDGWVRGDDDDDHDEDKCGMPAWATVGVVFIVFFFLMVMCVVTVSQIAKCCCKKQNVANSNCHRCAHQQATITVPVTNHYDASIPPPAYKNNPIV